MEDFVEAHLCKLCVILRSRVLVYVPGIMFAFTRFCRCRGFECVQEENGSAMRKAMVSLADNRTSVPQIWINQEHIGGCDDLKVRSLSPPSACCRCRLHGVCFLEKRAVFAPYNPQTVARRLVYLQRIIHL